jgi:uncharacterized protein GlcG (DUF336 family)
MKPIRFVCVVFAAALSWFGAAAAEEAPYAATRVLTAESANKVAMAALQACSKDGYHVAVAVTDRYGNMLAFVRSPLSGRHTIDVAYDKAYTAATFQGDTMTMGPRVPFLKGVAHISLVGGGVPVTANGIIYGAVGVSGAPAKKSPGDVDDDCARAGIKAVQEMLDFAP